MIPKIEQEMISTIQEIQRRFSVQDFENKFASTIKHYLKNSEDLSYYDMRHQLDMYFRIDMNPLFVYIINGMSMTYPNLNPYIKVIDKIKLQYGTILHWKHEAAINPLLSQKPFQIRSWKKQLPAKLAKSNTTGLLFRRNTGNPDKVCCLPVKIPFLKESHLTKSVTNPIPAKDFPFL